MQLSNAIFVFNGKILHPYESIMNAGLRNGSCNLVIDEYCVEG